LGLGVTIYFKVIKALAGVMIVCSFIAAPYLYYYSQGNFSDTF